MIQTLHKTYQLKSRQITKIKSRFPSDKVWVAVLLRRKDLCNFIYFRLSPLIRHLPRTFSNACCNMKVESTFFFLEVRCFLCLLKPSIQVLMSTLNCREENRIKLFLRHRVNWHKYELSVNIAVFVAWPDDCDSYLQCCPIYSIQKELCLTLLDNKSCCQ